MAGASLAVGVNKRLVSSCRMVASAGPSKSFAHIPPIRMRRQTGMDPCFGVPGPLTGTRAQREQSDLRCTVQADRSANRTQAYIGVEREPANPVFSSWILLAKWGQPRGPDNGKPDLTSMRMARQLKIDEMI